MNLTVVSHSLFKVFDLIMFSCGQVLNDPASVSLPATEMTRMVSRMYF